MRCLQQNWHRLLILTAFVILAVLSTTYLFSKEAAVSNNVSISEMLRGIPQNDSRLVDYFTKHHLIPAPDLPYNLNDMKGDPGSYVGVNYHVNKILNELRNGFFVECGANDGESMSNTVLFERKYGWKGILIEPDPYVFPILVSKNRKAWLTDVCLSPSKSAENLYFMHRVNYTVASILESSSKSGSRGLGTETEIVPEYWKKIEVTCFPFFTILSSLKIFSIDYFSLDVQGLELQILKTIPWDSVFIKVLSVDFHLIPEGGETLKSYMESKGYWMVAEVYQDYIFTHNSMNLIEYDLNGNSETS